jgi:hypothetical protein
VSIEKGEAIIQNIYDQKAAFITENAGDWEDLTIRINPDDYELLRKELSKQFPVMEYQITSYLGANIEINSIQPIGEVLIYRWVKRAT